jgi:hypothetical protein
MTNHLNLKQKENYKLGDTTYEIAVYAEEDGRLRGFISTGGFCRLIAEMSGEDASDMKTTTLGNPVEFLVSLIKGEIDAGKFPIAK